MISLQILANAADAGLLVGAEIWAIKGNFAVVQLKTFSSIRRGYILFCFGRRSILNEMEPTGTASCNTAPNTSLEAYNSCAESQRKKGL